MEKQNICLAQSFKQAVKKFSLPPKRALQEFLMQYLRTATSCELSLSEYLMSRQVHTRIDSLLPSPAHKAQGKQSKVSSKAEITTDSGSVAKCNVFTKFVVGYSANYKMSKQNGKNFSKDLSV
ncbi:Hypothetical predicted protein [Octopus vulgaris]|uniref:Uncharacterized protein n=1 Tax=Octopus vulgaris TaxID=6645 RepID=A0AA36AGK6_OCTVU|nr:Hypothetical predicted protein [Octopus vulgaris]